jgi:large conductance mechanosensitive channel
MLSEFKNFILKGNVVDLSTGVIIGAAFSAIVGAFTKGVVEPILALLGGGPSPKLTVPLMNKMVEVAKLDDAGKAVMKADGSPEMKMVEKLIELDLGLILGATIQFLITAAVIFFVIVKPANALLARMKKAEAAAPPPGPSDEVKLLTEIRDSLKR